MQPSPAALAGDPSPVEVQQGALSLKARETASLSLKRIFEQHLQMSTCNSTTATHSSTISLDHLQHQNENRDQHATLDVDLDLRLAAPSYTSAPYTDLAQHQVPNMQNINKSGNAEEAVNMSLISTSKVAQLTVFYRGTVCVFEDVSADKAKAIMLLAAGSARDQSCVNAAGKSRPTTPASSSDIILSRHVKPLTRSQAELPFARKASLARFLEKRKDRVEAKAAEGEIKNTSDPPKKKLCTKI